MTKRSAGVARPRRHVARLLGVLTSSAVLVGLIAPQAFAVFYNPSAWYQQSNVPPGFTARWDTASAAFPPSQEVVMFGGAPASYGQGWYNDTWIYTGGVAGSWVRGPAAPAGLTPRGGMAMVYDPDIGKIVLYQPCP